MEQSLLQVGVLEPCGHVLDLVLSLGRVVAVDDEEDLRGGETSFLDLCINRKNETKRRKGKNVAP